MRSLRKRYGMLSTLCAAWSMVALLAGCGAGMKEPELAHAEGIVKINGAPAANILVQFLPVVKEGDPGPTSTGTTNEKGEFHLETSDGKMGAVVGPCKVLFVDLTEERVPQGQTAKPPRLPASATVLSAATQQVEVKYENAPFDFDFQK